MLIPYFLNLLIVARSMDDELVRGPITQDFRSYLESNRQVFLPILRTVDRYGDLGSFGGRLDYNEELENQPIMFIHGNSDSALDIGASEWTSGWSQHIQYFKTRGYANSELYGLTYGDRNVSNSGNRKLDCETLVVHRLFIEAMLAYTQKTKLHIIAHSMGVTIGRLVVHGGVVLLDNEYCELGDDISDKVETFVALAGANYGMCSCYKYPFLNACNPKTGFFPGLCKNCTEDMCSKKMSPCSSYAENYSTILSKLNKHPKVAKVVASFWSEDDVIIGKDNWAWGRKTSLVPYTDILRPYRTLTHMQLKTDTVADQFRVIERQYLQEF